jgi:hypothetical protein
MGGAIPLLTQYVFMAWYLVKHRDNFFDPLMPLFHLPEFKDLLPEACNGT